MGRGIRIICGVALAMGLLAGAEQNSFQEAQSTAETAAIEQSLVASAPPAPETQWQTDPAEKNAQPGSNDRDIWDLFAQWVMALAAVITVGVVAYSAKLLRDTLNATRDTVAKAADGAEAAWAAVKTAQDANVMARDSVAAQHRAYVLVTHARIRWEEEPFVEIRVQNAGATPATAVSINMKIVRRIGPDSEVIAKLVRECPHLIAASGTWEGVVPEDDRDVRAQAARALSDAAIHSHYVVLEGSLTWKTLYDEDAFKAPFRFLVPAASNRDERQRMIANPRGRAFFRVKPKRQVAPP